MWKHRLPNPEQPRPFLWVSGWHLVWAIPLEAVGSNHVG